MQSFDAEENILLTQLIQGVSITEAKKEAQKILRDVNLDDVVIPTKKVVDYSGGQKQRIAFARAVVTNFKVLFGDEPTGNLDPNNAKILMGILKHKIQGTNNCSIVVSHDINLALDFADRIIVINKAEKKINNEIHSFGQIDQNSIYENSNGDWVNRNQKLKKEKLHSDLLAKMIV